MATSETAAENSGKCLEVIVVSERAPRAGFSSDSLAYSGAGLHDVRRLAATVIETAAPVVWRRPRDPCDPRPERPGRWAEAATDPDAPLDRRRTPAAENAAVKKKVPRVAQTFRSASGVLYVNISI
jgi:hypothetical protein